MGSNTWLSGMVSGGSESSILLLSYVIVFTCIRQGCGNAQARTTGNSKKFNKMSQF